MINARWTALGAALIVGVIVGMAVSWMLWKPGKKVVETYAPAVVQQDGSVQLERMPDRKAQPAHEIPKGAKVERIVRVVVQPTPGRPAADPAGTSGTLPQDGGNPPAATPCPPVQVDLTLVRLPDGMRRVTVSSPNGLILPQSVDIPVESAAPVKELKWAAGAVYRVHPWGDAKGVFLDRDWAFVRVGAELAKVNLNLPTGGRLTGDELTAKVGIRF